MSASPKQHAIRRSTRLPLEVPILVTSLDPSFEFSEECVTTLVNAHGCGLVVQRSMPRDLPVRLEIVRAKRHTTARVADVVPLGGDPETWLLGMQLDSPGNFWGIDYAPSDWKIEETSATSIDSDVPRPVDETVAPAPRRWRLSDITADACYLEAGTPFPIATPVLLSVRVNDFECVLEGIVRASYAQSGMGVEFISNEYQHRTRVEELIRHLVSQREVPRVFVGRKENSEQPPSKSPASAVADSTDPLLNLIRNGDSLSLDEFQEHLKAQRLGPLEHES
ncbi:MAG TPA: hypothetical protein VEU94_11560 [Terriglobales bacterium]|nr:hypothetical protein [Terriglobales bacterium]